MKPEKFENSIKQALGEREIKPSAAAWEKLEQRLDNKKKKRPYLAWIASAAAVAAVFFVLGTYFSASTALEQPKMVEQEPAAPVLQEKTFEPEVIQLASEVHEDVVEEKKASAERPVKNAILEAPVSGGSEETALASETPSEANQFEVQEKETAVAETVLKDTSEENHYTNSDAEAEALLLMATAQLEPKSSFIVNSNDLLNQVEYELDQSFRQKVFEVVKEGLSKAKTAVANRDF